jgi:uncharacterized protein YyaL (SSP411 family)
MLSPHLPDSLRAAIDERWAERRAHGYLPRTRHLLEGGAPRYVNRLFLETSPYLLQHAHNPVDWRPWGDEAFAEAKASGRPVLLSVGYSTCHWCHVMEEESFEDEEIAAYINQSYVPVKVDREERPDVDAVYMKAVQALSGGHGGWPMTVWLTHDRRPYFGGTYFPPRDGDRGARTGFLTLLRELRRIHDQDPGRVERAAGGLVEAIRERADSAPAATAPPGVEVQHKAFAYYQRAFDREHGGIRGAPKFPSSLPVRWLLRYHARFGEPEALTMASRSLEAMARGGIYDHVGGGFARYSVDDVWLVPHFEKMLYDNALLAQAYVEAWQVTGRADFETVAREVLDYAVREMTSPDGAFYAATDADSPNPEKHGEREEGWFFTWTVAELRAALPPDEADAALAWYAVGEGGNFEGRSILHTPRSAAEVARELKCSEEQLARRIAAAKAKLYETRRRRPPPLRDDKILAAWNGLMISAFARAGFAFGDDGYVEQAARAARFVTERMMVQGRLQRSFMDGRARFEAYLDDHGALAVGLLDLFEATQEPRWLDAARQLVQAVLDRFEDKARGGFFATGEGHEALLVRVKPDYDGAEPSGNSLVAQALARLAALTGDDRWRAALDRTLGAFAPILRDAPMALAEMLIAADLRLGDDRQIVIAAGADREAAESFVAKLRPRFLPRRALLVTARDERGRALAALAPWTAELPAQQGKPTAYVCVGTRCELPVTDPAAFDARLEQPT